MIKLCFKYISLILYIKYGYFVNILMLKRGNIISVNDIIISFLCSSVQHTALIGRDHVFNIDEGILTTMDFKVFEGLLDQVSQVLTLSLAIVDLVTHVLVLYLEQVQHRQYLSVVRD